MFEDLKGQRVLITGSTQGIGLAAAHAFVRAGAKVGLNGRSTPARMSAVLEELRLRGADIEYFQAELSESRACEQLVNAFVSRFGGIDTLINNAGGLVGRKSVEQIDDAFCDEVMNLNARSALMMTKFALPHLKTAAQGAGRTASVILVGSIAAHTGGGPGASLYGAAKAWLHNIQKNWVTYHSKDGIRFNTVSPGTFDTLFHADKTEEVRAKICATIPMGRFGRAEECSPAFLFLASHACSGYITGQVLDINGGQYMP